MAIANQKLTVHVEYRDGRIELSGERAALGAEAQRILRRFRFSARPYRVFRVEEHHVVLAPLR